MISNVCRRPSLFCRRFRKERTYAATAGSGTYTMLNSNVSDSICPKGWTLPHSAEGNKSYHYLFTKYNASAADTISSPFNFLLAGRYSYSSSAMFGQELSGYLWTSSAATSINYAYQLNLSSSDIFTQSSRFNKSYGLQVRCVARWFINRIYNCFVQG